MMSSFWLLLIIFTHFTTAINSELAFVKPNSSVSCATSSQQRPCLTFNEYAQRVDQYFVDNTTFLFQPGTHELDAPLNLKDLSNVLFAPLDDLDARSVQILLSPSANITWTNCENIEISGFVFILSGQFSILPDDDFVSALFSVFQGTTVILTNLTLIGNGTRMFAFCNSSDIQIGDLEVTGTKGPLLEAFFCAIAFYGQNYFNSLMINNVSDDGFVMLLYACHYSFSGKISFVNSTSTAAIYILQAYPNSIISGNVSFINNTFKEEEGQAGYAIIFIDSTDNNISGNILFFNNTLPQGGSLIQFCGVICYISGNISFLQNKLITDLEIQDIDFNGGAPIFSYNSTLFISGVALFVHNLAIAHSKKSDASGGAIYAVSQSRVTFEETSNVSFIENSAASYGGAICVVQSNLTMNGRVLFENNSAGLGGGAIANNHTYYYYYEDTPSISVINCSGKSIIFRNNTSHGSGGAIFLSADSYNVIRVELKDVRFERNTATLDGGAAYSYNSIINMKGTMDFYQNSAQRGGAMAFTNEYLGALRLIDPLTANFTENSATLGGGVIFFQDITSIDRICLVNFDGQPDCLIELSSRVNIRLTFDDNTATTGKIFYGGYLDICIPSVNRKRLFDEKILDIFTSISNVHVNVSNPKEGVSNVSSNPIQVCICKSGRRICNNTEMVTIRGKLFPLQAVVLGKSERPVFPSAVRISLDSGILISAAQRVQTIGNGCTDISYGLLAKNDTTVTLFPDNGPCRDYGIGRTIIRVTFLPCPNGFDLNVDKCVCDKRLQRFNASCNVNDNSIIIRTLTSNRVWVGALYENDSNESTYQGLILHSGCPFDYCVDRPVPITLDNLDIQCNHNHSGILCGSCKEGYSIALGNLHCLPCSNDYLALILPFALAGIALVALLLLLRLTVSAGTINGLIFYANIVQANTSFFFPAGESNILTVFIAWLNLDLGIETCFYDGMTTYAYTWLQFVFPFYVWFLIGLIIVATHYSSKLTKIFGRNPVTALATLFLLSYSKLHRAIIGTLSFSVLEYPENSYKNVWFFKGSMAYGSAEHAILVIFAIVILVFLFVPYTLLLFFAQWLQALSHWRIFSWLNKIKPFIDTYHAPYKKQTRYWTGLLLFMRILLFAFDAINKKLIPVVITSITVVLTSLAWMHNMGIYEKYFNNVLEAFFITNLCIFAAATYYVQTNDLSRAVTTNIFVGLAFAAFVCILLFHVYLILRETAVWKETLIPNAKKYLMHKKEENEDQPPHEQSPLLPTKTTVELRESLLDS